MNPERQTIEEFAEALDQLLAAMNVPSRDQSRITRTIADMLEDWDWDGEDSVATALLRSLPILRRS
jgi:hypothetical protein